MSGEANPDPFNPRKLRDAFGSFATGVTIITAANKDGISVGLTANSFSSVSLDPPLVSWNLANDAPSLEVFQSCSHYAIHVLRAEQRELALRFSQSRNDKFAGIKPVIGLGNAPLLNGSLTIFECLNTSQHSGGDHVIFLGEIKRFKSEPGEPLVFHTGQFHDIAK